MTKFEAVERLEVIVKASENPVYDYEIKSNLWENYGKSRTYLSIVETRKDGASKHYKEKNMVLSTTKQANIKQKNMAI